MPESLQPLMYEFLSWVSCRRRTYAEAMEGWRTTCPRQTVWEDALLAGFIELESVGPLRQSEVILTPRGRASLTTYPAMDVPHTDLGS
jgi:hypothetical protein